MRRAETARSNLLLFAVFFIPVVWAALLAAPALSKGLPALLLYLSEAINNPFQIQWVEDTPRSLLLFTLIYGISVGIYLASPRNYRRREEHGSARWGKAGRINAKYRDKQPEQNKILTQQVRIGLDGRKHRRNLNVLVVGGSGSGKTRFYAKPNVMQAHTSFVVLDPKGEILRDTGHLLKSEGYDIKVLDLINPDRSHGYNAFAYL